MHMHTPFLKGKAVGGFETWETNVVFVCVLAFRGFCFGKGIERVIEKGEGKEKETEKEKGNN